MSRAIFNITDVRSASINHQQIVYSTSFEDKDTNKVYFITAVGGTSITNKDKDSNTKMVLASHRDFNTPLRLDGGFEFTGTGSSCQYFWMNLPVE